jgi:hypothetical protein
MEVVSELVSDVSGLDVLVVGVLLSAVKGVLPTVALPCTEPLPCSEALMVGAVSVGEELRVLVIGVSGLEELVATLVTGARRLEVLFSVLVIEVIGLDELVSALVMGASGLEGCAETLIMAAKGLGAEFRGSMPDATGVPLASVGLQLALSLS